MQLLLHNFHAVHAAIQSRSLSMSMAKQLISKFSNVLQIENSIDKNVTDFYQQVTGSQQHWSWFTKLARMFWKLKSTTNIITFSELSLQQPLQHHFKSAHNLLTTQFLMNNIGFVIDLENVLSLAGNEQSTQSITKFYESDVDLSMLNTELAQIHLLHSNNVKSPDNCMRSFVVIMSCYFPIWQHY